MRSNPFFRQAVVAFGAALLVAVVGALMTRLGPWYYALQQPSWKPPDAAFGPVWTTIFGLCAVAGLYTWRSDVSRRARSTLVGLFAFNAVANWGWSFLFFVQQRPDLALLEVGVLWLSIAALIVFCAKHTPRAWLLLVPYLLWVSYAAAINYAIVRLNGPFGA